jgi:hypothetical protein
VVSCWRRNDGDQSHESATDLLARQQDGGQFELVPVVPPT